jgi:chromosome segregation ATPase
LQAEVRIKELTGRLAVVDAVEASLATVANLSAHLDRKVGDLEGRAALVDGVEARLSNLGTLSQEIGGRIDALLDQRRELESMRLTQDALALQLGDLQRLATMLQSSPRLGEMETQVRTLESSLLASLRRLNEVDNLNEALSEGELTLAALSERASVLATSIARQDGILTGVKESAERAEKSRSAWLEELARVESQHESAHEQLATTAQQIAAAEALVAKLEQARSGLESTEARIVEFQSRVSKLDESMGRLDRQTDLVESRTGMIDHLKKEIETLLASTEEHRKKAMQVVSAKKDILEAKEHLIAVNAQAEQIDRRMEVIQRRLAAVEDIELKVDTLHNTLADIDVSVDAFGEQKAVIDHIAEKLSRIDFEIRRAESVTRALQEERELAWRIQQGLKSVRRTKEVDEGEASAPLVRMKADERRVEGTEKKA